MYRSTAERVSLKQKYLKKDETRTSINHLTNNHKISTDNANLFIKGASFDSTVGGYVIWQMYVNVITYRACIKFHSPN